MHKATLWLTMFLAVAVGGCGGREPEAWEALLEEAVEWKAFCERASKKVPGTGIAEVAEEWRVGLETASKAAKENPGAAEEWKTLLEESKKLRVVMERGLKASEEGDVEAMRKVRREIIEIWEEAKRSSEKTEEEFFREVPKPPAGGAAAQTQGASQEPAGEIPVLAIEPMIQPAPGAPPIRVVKESQEGVWCEDELKQPILVRKEDLESEKAKRIPGIRQAIEDMATVYRQELPTNLSAAQKFRDKALDLYDRRNAEPRNLFGAVRCFQQALAYYGGKGFFPNQPTVDKIYLDALKEFEAEISREYNNAVVDEKASDVKRATQRYQRILNMIPEKDNPIVKNVIRRLTALRERETER